MEPYQLSTSPTRTGLIPTRQFQPYGTSYARVNKHRNAEAGPSTLLPPLVPYVDLPTPQHSGGIPETTADADTNKAIAEEDKTTVSNVYHAHIPHAIEWSCGARLPSGLGALVVKDDLAHSTYRCRKMEASCVPWCSGTRDSKEPRPSTRL